MITTYIAQIPYFHSLFPWGCDRVLGAVRPDVVAFALLIFGCHAHTVAARWVTSAGLSPAVALGSYGRGAETFFDILAPFRTSCTNSTIHNIYNCIPFL